MLGVRRVAARQVDFVEERIRPVFAAVGFGADAVLEPAVASGFESARWGIDGLGCGYGEAGEEGFEGDHLCESVSGFERGYCTLRARGGAGMYVRSVGEKRRRGEEIVDEMLHGRDLEGT